MPPAVGCSTETGFNCNFRIVPPNGVLVAREFCLCRDVGQRECLLLDSVFAQPGVPKLDIGFARVVHFPVLRVELSHLCAFQKS